MDEKKRALLLLAGSFGLSWVSITLLAAPGPAAWVTISGRAADAGAYYAVFSLSSAVGAALAGRAMDRFGRRPILAGAHLVAGAGFALAGLAYQARSLRLFAAAIAMSAASLGAIALTRLAAAELFGPQERARGVARVAVAATFGAITGPLLLIFSGPIGALFGQPADEIVWWMAAPLFLVASFLVGRAPLVVTAAAPAGAAESKEIPRFPFLAALVALVCAQAAMVTIMGVAGVSLRHAGHGAGTTGVVMAMHFVGMFGLSLVVGRIADRAGRRVTILVGLGIMAAGGLVSALVAGAVGLALGLLLIGLGWSFAYISGTVVLADIVPAARRARTMGLVDFTVAILAAAGSWSGGLWYAQRGLSGLGLVAIAIVAIPAVFALMLREPRAGSYGASSGDRIGAANR